LRGRGGCSSSIISGSSKNSSSGSDIIYSLISFPGALADKYFMNLFINLKPKSFLLD
jgi:hypothetical protein